LTRRPFNDERRRQPMSELLVIEDELSVPVSCIAARFQSRAFCTICS
jgi:hypothetical protein